MLHVIIVLTFLVLLKEFLIVSEHIQYLSWIIQIYSFLALERYITFLVFLVVVVIEFIVSFTHSIGTSRFLQYDVLAEDFVPDVEDVFIVWIICLLQGNCNVDIKLLGYNHFIKCFHKFHRRKDSLFTLLVHLSSGHVNPGRVHVNEDRSICVSKLSFIPHCTVGKFKKVLVKHWHVS